MPKFEFLTCQRVLSIIVLVGFMIHHMLRVNISIAIVEMVVKNHSNINHGPRYNWNEEEKNNVLGCFFWGYVITQIPGGRLSEKFGTKIVVGVGLSTASILTILTPIASQYGYYWLLATRFCLGVALGIHWSSTAPLASKWIPPAETSMFMSHMTASSLGAAITLPTCGYLITYWGWPSVFYVTGSITVIWTISWFYLMYDTPEQHPRISTDEKEKLRKKINFVDSSVNAPPIPWKKILTSGPVWALIVGNSCASCTFFVAFSHLPTYMSDVLHYNIKENGWFSSLPYLVRYFASVTFSIAAKKLLQRKKFSTTTVRKFCTVLLFAGTSFIFTLQSFWGNNSALSIIVFTGSLGLMGLATPGIYANPIDIAPAYSGTIFGISGAPAALTGYFTTKFIALVTREKQSFKQWTYVFWMLVAVNLFTSIFSIVFTSGEEQSWSWKKEEREVKTSECDDDNHQL